MNSELPYNCDYAKSGRASCKKCRNHIDKDTLRLAVMVQSPVFDGKMPLWHHASCFFMTKNIIKSTNDIANFHNLRWEDQELIKNKMSSQSSGKSCWSGDPNFSVEIAKSNRSSCKVCGDKIEKGALRIAKIDFEPGSKSYPKSLWHHVDCFIQNIDEIGFSGSAANINGYGGLSEEDQKLLSEKFPSDKVAKKRKLPVEASESKKTSEDKLFKAQNKMLFDMRDNLSKEFSKKQMIELLTVNNQHIPHGESRLLDHLADCLVFGGIKECPECKNARPRFLNNIYACPGYLTEWAKCQFETKFPEREEFVAPAEFQEKFSFLKDYKCKIRERLFPATNEPSTSKQNLPLSGYNISVVGSKTFININQGKIEELGGTYEAMSRLSSDVHFIIAVENDVKKPKKMGLAERLKIHVVSPKFFVSLEKGSPVGHSVKEHCISPWGDDPILKFGIKKENVVKKKAEDHSLMFQSSAPKRMKVSVKGVAAVDPESGLELSCHVYQNKESVYNAVLTYVDIVKGTNSYYKLQLLKSNKGFKFYVFRQWGRVGTSIGGTKTENYQSLEEAIAEFECLYLEKTGNEWCCRKNFEKRPGMMYPVDIDYGEEDLQAGLLKPSSESKLPTAVQELICLIFDVEAMKKAMVEFEIDLKKMPLGKLSKKQIESAYQVLSEAQQILTSGHNASKIMDASNRFYTLIPHDFGMRKPPLLDDEELIKSKVGMLDSLLEIAFAYSMLKREQSQKDPVTFNYEKLNTDISMLEKYDNEYEMIEKYLNNTHAPTHTQYTLKIEEVFKINRSGEDDRYSKFKNLHNKKLLWHGSRVTNYVGILSQGLRIAPPEAPPTGYMFGKGVYFADMVSKSANYCWTSQQNNTGLLLLCEVALGNMLEKTSAEFIVQLPENYHSTKGMGITIPKAKETIYKGDVEIPCGRPSKSKIKNSHLLYNEYIVYDVSQIKIKYLVKVKFNYNDY